LLIRIALPVADRDAAMAHSLEPWVSTSARASRVNSFAGLMIQS
jgi:hypothetical protein